MDIEWAMFAVSLGLFAAALVFYHVVDVGCFSLSFKGRKGSKTQRDPKFENLSLHISNLAIRYGLVQLKWGPIRYDNHSQWWGILERLASHGMLVIAHDGVVMVHYGEGFQFEPLRKEHLLRGSALMQRLELVEEIERRGGKE